MFIRIPRNFRIGLFRLSLGLGCSYAAAPLVDGSGLARILAALLLLVGFVFVIRGLAALTGGK